MAAAGRKTLRGHLSILQDDRFRLIGETGRSFLFTLAHNASISDAELRRFYRLRVPVTVEYEGEPDMASGIAHSVRPAGQGSPG